MATPNSTTASLKSQLQRLSRPQLLSRLQQECDNSDRLIARTQSAFDRWERAGTKQWIKVYKALNSDPANNDLRNALYYLERVLNAMSAPCRQVPQAASHQVVSGV